MTCVLCLLQGIPSNKVFELQPETLVFKMNPGLQMTASGDSYHCQNSASLLESVAEFVEAGSLFMHLREFQEFMQK